LIKSNRLTTLKSKSISALKTIFLTRYTKLLVHITHTTTKISPLEPSDQHWDQANCSLVVPWKTINSPPQADWENELVGDWENRREISINNNNHKLTPNFTTSNRLKQHFSPNFIPEPITHYISHILTSKAIIEDSATS